MEKWRCRGKNTNKVKINHGNCGQQYSTSSSGLLSSEKKEKKWTFSGLLKRISKNEISTRQNVDDISSSVDYSNNLDSKNRQSPNLIGQLTSNFLLSTHNQRKNSTTNEYHEKVINNSRTIEHESQDSCINLYNPSIHSRNSESSSEAFKCSGGNNSRRNLIKARIKAKRERYCENSSSSDDEQYSNCSLGIIQSEDNLQNMYRSDNNRRTRGARTERYMKRFHRDDFNVTNHYHNHNHHHQHQHQHHKVMKNNVHTFEQLPLIKNEKQPTDVLSPYLWTTNGNTKLVSIKKIPQLNYQSFNHKHNDMGNNISSRNNKRSIDLYENVYNDKCTRSLNRGYKITPITNNVNKSLEAHEHIHKVQPPLPPPRSSKSRLYTTPLHYSIKSSGIEDEYLDKTTRRHKELPRDSNANCNSLDRLKTTQKSKNSYDNMKHKNKKLSRHSFNGELNNDPNYSEIQKKESFDNFNRCVEASIVPDYQQVKKISPPAAIINRNDKFFGSPNQHDKMEIERRRHSKNLEEALQELETIYNSLHLNNDEDLLDRAEQRSMDEYREKIALTGIEGSIKSSSDISSSYEMSHESTCRYTTNFDQCPANDTRLKDDMAYRRIHQHERSLSVDPNQMSLSQYSYLTNSPILSQYNDSYYNDILNINKPKSRRSTPDLMRDDVVFRTINHANNTLKIIEPQPPFGIPLGPVTTAAESDYLHVELTKNSPRSSYIIPKPEPDIITDDLAFRNLRKDTTKSQAGYSSNTNFIQNIGRSPEMKKKRAVRSLSADLYGIINKNNDSKHAWYKEFVKLSHPRRFSDSDGDLSTKELNTNSWMSNREYFDLDVNGNRPKSAYQGRIQVCVPQEDDKLMDNELNENNVDDIDEQIPNVTKTIEKLTTDNNELTEYKELCHNLECLINKISEKAKNVEVKSSNEEWKRSSLDNFVEWNKFLSENDTRSMKNKSDELLKSSIENETRIEPKVVEEQMVKKLTDHDKLPYKLSDINNKELRDSPKNTLSLIIGEDEKELKNEDNNVVIDENTCTKFNLPNNVPYESSDVTQVKNNTSNMEIIEKNLSQKNNNHTDDNNEDNDDNDVSPIPININENTIVLESNGTKDSMAIEPFLATLQNLTVNNDDNDDVDDVDDDDDIKQHDCIDESSISEGRETCL